MNKTFSYGDSCDGLKRAVKFYSEIADGLIERKTKTPFPIAYFVDQEGSYTGYLS